MKTAACVATFVVMAGCDTLPIIREPVEVIKPVPVPCVNLVDVPVRPPSARADVSESTDPVVRARAALVDLKRQDGYIPQLEAALSKCVRL